MAMGIGISDSELDLAIREMLLHEEDRDRKTIADSECTYIFKISSSGNKSNEFESYDRFGEFDKGSSVKLIEYAYDQNSYDEYCGKKYYFKYAGLHARQIIVLVPREVWTGVLKESFTDIMTGELDQVIFV